VVFLVSSSDDFGIVNVLDLAVRPRLAGRSPSKKCHTAPARCLEARRSCSSDQDRMLATTFHSPATNPAFTVSIPGSKFPAYRFASSQPLPRPVRPFALPPTPGLPRVGSLNAQGPLPLPPPA
jgi:hypothetical protein